MPTSSSAASASSQPAACWARSRRAWPAPSPKAPPKRCSSRYPGAISSSPAWLTCPQKSSSIWRLKPWPIYCNVRTCAFCSACMSHSSTVSILGARQHIIASCSQLRKILRTPARTSRLRKHAAYGTARRTQVGQPVLPVRMRCAAHPQGGIDAHPAAAAAQTASGVASMRSTSNAGSSQPSSPAPLRVVVPHRLSYLIRVQRTVLAEAEYAIFFPDRIHRKTPNTCHSPGHTARMRASQSNAPKVYSTVMHVDARPRRKTVRIEYEHLGIPAPSAMGTRMLMPHFPQYAGA